MYSYTALNMFIKSMQFYKLTWLFKEMQDGNNK